VVHTAFGEMPFDTDPLRSQDESDMLEFVLLGCDKDGSEAFGKQVANQSEDETDLDLHSNSGMSESSGPSSVGFFQASERKVPNLRRGWCTPDPSPTHDGGAGLPACSVMKLCMQRLEGLPSSPREQQRDSSSSPPRSRCVSPCRTRTPSPQRDYYSRAGSPAPTACSPTLGSMSCPPALSWYADPLEATNFMFIEDFTPWVMVPMIDSTGFADGTCEVEQEGEEEDEQEPVPSIGSKGHKQGKCADACKYACKPRGCKDGLSCTRCHLCDWRNRKRICKFGAATCAA